MPKPSPNSLKQRANLARLGDLDGQQRRLDDKRREIEAQLPGNPGSRASAAVRGSKAEKRTLAIRKLHGQLGGGSGLVAIIAAKLKCSTSTVKRALKEA